MLAGSLPPWPGGGRRSAFVPSPVSFRGMSTPPDFAAIATGTFGDAAAAEPLRQLVETLERYHEGHGRMRSPARQRARFIGLSKTASKLLQGLRALDASDRADLFRREAPPDADAEGIRSDAYGGPLRLHGLRDAVTCMDLLEQIARKAPLLAEAGPEPAGGRPERPDPIAFGVECLAAIWRDRTSRPMTRGTKAGGFGALCRQVLTAPPLSFPANSVWHAVHRYLGSHNQGTSG